VPTLTVWRYDTPLGAEAGAARLKALQDREALTVLDAVTVAWLPGAHQPRIGQLRTARPGAPYEGSVLGALVRMLILAAGGGATSAAQVSAIAQRLHGTGIDQVFLEGVVAHLAPRTSALLVLSSHPDMAVVRPVVERGLSRGDVVLLHVDLTEDAPAALRAAVRDLGPQNRVASTTHRSVRDRTRHRASMTGRAGLE
jgi:uncharacterized membrane protein